MEQLTQVVISLADSMKPSTPTSSPGTPEDQPTLCWDLSGKSLTKELKSFVKSLQTQDTWMIVQARRKREKEDLMSQNPGFDPCFMKVWACGGLSAVLVFTVHAASQFHPFWVIKKEDQIDNDGNVNLLISKLIDLYREILIYCNSFTMKLGHNMILFFIITTFLY